MSPRCLLAALLCSTAPLSAGAAPCPEEGGTVVTEMIADAAAGDAQVNVSGTLLAGSCDGGGRLQTTYSRQFSCSAGAPCTATHDGLAPGLWVHRILVTGGEGLGQLQARRSFVMDRTAGTHQISWPLFRSVAIVFTTADSPDCAGCLRRALAESADAAKPALIMFNAATVGSIVLSEPLPELAADRVTIDTFDFDGAPHRRTIDANGLPNAALRVTGSDNRVLGLRIVNVGGDSDAFLIDGSAAHANRVESLQIVGRALETCEIEGVTGCRIDGRCVVPNAQAPRGDCGDDAIAVRQDAGTGGANVFVDADVSGAFDKGIKVSEGAVARVEHGRFHDNADGGMQATLGGVLTAIENLVEDNSGPSANGIAANGPDIDSTDPAILSTRGNLTRRNSLRGLSVRSLSLANLRDDFSCGNGTEGTGDGFGLAVLDAAGFSAFADVRGTALVKNVSGGVLTLGASSGSFGDLEHPGRNAIAFNGAGSPLEGAKNFRNFSSHSFEARGNHWEGCGEGYRCDEEAVAVDDIESPAASVFVEPARAKAIRSAPTIEEIRPSFAREGELVWIYGRDFDALGAARQDTDCDGPARPCAASDANCVFVDRQPAEIVAVTPTAMVIRAPFTCVAPVELALRTRRSRGFARASFCHVEPGSRR